MSDVDVDGDERWGREFIYVEEDDGDKTAMLR